MLVRRTVLLVCLASLLALGSPAAANEPPVSDVAIAITDAADPVEVGDDIRYTITVTNNGASEATGVTASWQLGPGLLLRSARTGAVVCSSSCSLGTLAPAESKTVEVAANANPNRPGDIVTSASVTITEPDAVSANDVAETATSVRAPAAGAWKPHASADASPVKRVGAAAALHEPSGRVILFGGLTGEESPVTLADTWLWDGSVWTRVYGGPSARAFAQIAYNPIDGTVVLFGGVGENGMLSDTWTWNGSSWSQRFPQVPTPPARAAGGLAYAGGRLVLFGGAGQTGDALGDTWLWDTTKWIKMGPGGPSARDSFAFATDRHANVAILHGGCCDAADNGLGDTWSHNGTAWTRLAPSLSPGIREGAVAAWDPIASAVALFGGADGSYDPQNDLWLWTGSTWGRQATASEPAARDSHALAFSPGTGIAPGRLVTFGGWNSAGDLLGDTHSVATTPRARLGASPARLSFGGEIVGLAKTLTATIVNNGAGTATIGAPSISGSHAPEYSLVRNGCSEPLAGGSSCSLDVRFAPRGATANRAATLTVPTSVGAQTVGLVGQGFTITARLTSPTSRSSTNAAFPVSWGPLQNIAFDVEWTTRNRASNGSYVQAPWKTWKSGTTAGGAWFGGKGEPASGPGNTYLFRVRGRSPNGVGPWSPVASAIVPLDDRSSWMRWTGSWSNVSANGRYFGTLRQTTTTATMTVVADTNMFQLIGEKCSTCGRFKVYLDGAYIGVVDTKGSSPLRDVLWYRYLSGGIRRHTLKIVGEATAKRPTVKIDAIAVAR